MNIEIDPVFDDKKMKFLIDYFFRTKEMKSWKPSLKIIIRSKTESEINARGSASYALNRKKEKKFYIIELAIDDAGSILKSKSRKIDTEYTEKDFENEADFIETLFHEMYHIWQYDTGKLRWEMGNNGKPQIVWYNKVYPIDYDRSKSEWERITTEKGIYIKNSFYFWLKIRKK